MPRTTSDRRIIAQGFKGMDNQPTAEGKLLDDQRQLTPHVVLNADVTDGGVLRRRGGYQLVRALDIPHSLWAESIMLCVAAGGSWPQTLFRLEGELAKEICEVPGPQASMSYVEIGTQVYFSNPYWSGGIYDLVSEAVTPWGVALPPAPQISIVSGDLPPGTYSFCYTNVQGDRLGGNGPLVQVSWEGGSRGVQLNNLPAGALCWMTHPNGKDLFLALVSGGMVNSQSPWLKPLPSFMVQPPPGFRHFVFAFGRIWGARGNKVYYSDPFQPTWFRPKNFLAFTEEIVLIAPAMEGLFVNSRTSTWSMEGRDPAAMKQTRVGNGAIPGTLCMAEAEAGHFTISRPVSFPPTPNWMNSEGFMIGSHSGHLLTKTKFRLQINPRAYGSSLFRNINGISQVVTSLFGPPGGVTELEEIFARGRMYIPAPLEVVGSGGVIVSGP